MVPCHPKIWPQDLEPPLVFKLPNMCGLRNNNHVPPCLKSIHPFVRMMGLTFLGVNLWAKRRKGLWLALLQWMLKSLEKKINPTFPHPHTPHLCVPTNELPRNEEKHLILVFVFLGNFSNSCPHPWGTHLVSYRRSYHHRTVFFWGGPFSFLFLFFSFQFRLALSLFGRHCRGRSRVQIPLAAREARPVPVGCGDFRWCAVRVSAAERAAMERARGERRRTRRRRIAWSLESAARGGLVGA